MSGYNFVESDVYRPSGSIPIEYELIMRQQPIQAKIHIQNKEKERRAVDPPPIIQVKIKDERQDPWHNYLQSPHLFVCADHRLCNATEPETTAGSNMLAGTTVSSLHRLKDIDNADGGFFVFGDLSVKYEGEFRVKFHLYEVVKDTVYLLESITSSPFKVFPAKGFPGTLPSTFLSRSFSDQGVRIRIRKEHRIKMKPPRQRAPISPEQRPPYATPDPQVPVSQTASRYTAGSQGNTYVSYEGRPQPEQNYAAGPRRLHGTRQAYQPYPQPYSPVVFFEPPEMHYSVSPYAVISPGSHVPHEYGVPSNYARTQPLFSASREPYYMSSDPRAAAHPYHDLPERRTKSYTESQRGPEQRPYQSPFPPDPANTPQYKPDPYAYGQSMQYSPLDRRPPHPHYYHPAPNYQPHESQRIRAGAQIGSSDAVFQAGNPPYGYSPQQYSTHSQRESRYSISAILTEDGRLNSPLAGSGAGSESSSMGRSTPLLRGDPSRRGSMEDHAASARLPPLRNGSNADRQVPAEQSQSKSNSNLWKLVSAATKE